MEWFRSDTTLTQNNMRAKWKTNRTLTDMSGGNVFPLELKKKS